MKIKASLFIETDNEKIFIGDRVTYTYKDWEHYNITVKDDLIKDIWITCDSKIEIQFVTGNIVYVHKLNNIEKIKEPSMSEILSKYKKDIDNIQINDISKDEIKILQKEMKTAEFKDMVNKIMDKTLRDMLSIEDDEN